MFPLFLDLRGRRCLVVGGGPVGRRKATALLRAGAEVRLVCLETATQLTTPRQPEWVQEPYRAEHLRDVALAFAAATPLVNRQVAADARARGIWVNIADDPQASDFHVPAAIRRGDLALAVSTGGASPLLARAVKARLESEFDETFGHWVTLLKELRDLVRQQFAPGQRRAALEHLTQWQWLERLRAEGPARVRRVLREELRRLAGRGEASL
jgi:precorrin-2 dehydrogenase/sirohydrochlorin ferrochelatase